MDRETNKRYKQQNTGLVCSTLCQLTITIHNHQICRPDRLTLLTTTHWELYVRTTCRRHYTAKQQTLLTPRRPIVLHTTLRIAAELKRQKCSIWNTRRGNFRGSVFFHRLLWLHDIRPTAKLSEEVNRKCRDRNTTVQLLTRYTDRGWSQQKDRRTDRRQYHANSQW